MSAMDFFRSAAKNMHKDFSDAFKGLTSEQLHFRPLEKGNPISFIVWHCVRTEDTVINFMLQKKPTVWMAEGWDKKFGMDARAQGTGMTAEQAAAVRISDINGFEQYIGNVFKSTEEYLAGVKDEDLAEVRDLPVLGKRSLYQVIGGTVLQHGSSHLGEMWYVRGILGLKGSPI